MKDELISVKVSSGWFTSVFVNTKCKNKMVNKIKLILFIEIDLTFLSKSNEKAVVTKDIK